MVFSLHDEIVALGREPISAASPVGDPCRYEESFERLQAQLDRIGSLTGEEVQWGLVVELATALLKTKSKDLLVMTYLTLGLFEQYAYAGLAAALQAYGEFLKNFWEQCYPKVKPPHGRFNAVQYLADRLLPLVELKGGQCKKMPVADDKELVHRCAELIDNLDKTVSTAFAPLGETPNLLPVSRAFRALKERVGPIGQPAPETTPAAGMPTAAPGGAPAVAPTAAMPETFATASQAAEAVLRVAKYLLAQDNKDARPYRLARAVHFGGLTAPPKDALLPPIQPQRRQFFEKLATDGNWAELLSQAEGQFVVTPLWLDVQRFVATAMKNLGAAYAAAYQAVAIESMALHARMPELFDLTFKDRSPFADGATKAWVDGLVAEFGGGRSGGGRAIVKDALSAATADARKLLTESKPAEAVARLSAAADGAAGGRQRFRAQLALARLLADMNRFSLALALLEQLEAQADRIHLDEWEPDLAAELFQCLHECFRRSKPKPTPEELQRAGQIFGRLCRVDPNTALKVDSAPKT